MTDIVERLRKSISYFGPNEHEGWCSTELVRGECDCTVGKMRDALAKIERLDDVWHTLHEENIRLRDQCAKLTAERDAAQGAYFVLEERFAGFNMTESAELHRVEAELDQARAQIDSIYRLAEHYQRYESSDHYNALRDICEIVHRATLTVREEP